MRTDIAGFLGYTERGPIHFEPGEVPAKLTSWAEFLSAFGGPIRHGNLAYAVKGFFANGGTTCYVVRVTGPSARTARYSQPVALPESPLTTLTGSASKSQAELPVGYTGTVAAGNFVSLTGTTGRQVMAVESAGHGRMIRVSSGLHAAATSGAAVSKLAGVAGSSLASAASRGQDRIVVADPKPFAADDLVILHGAGIDEVLSIVALEGATLLLDRKLEADHAVGEAVTLQTVAFSITAASPGNWGNRIRVRTLPLEPGTFSLRVTVDPGDDTTRSPELEFYRRLKLSEAQASVARLSKLIRLSDEVATLGSMPQLDIYLTGGRDGLSEVTEREFTGAADDRRGLRLLEDVDEIAILCAPDAVFSEPPRAPTPAPPQTQSCDAPLPPKRPDPAADDPTAIPPVLTDPGDPIYARIYDAMIDQCRRLRYRVAVLDPPDGLQPEGVLSLTSLWATPAARWAAMYYPWLKVGDSLSPTGESRRIPAGGHACGVYASIDRSTGVQRPPANQAMEFVDDVGEDISNLQQEPLNDGGINVIRAFPGRGIRMWGARSLWNTPPWRFIHVRRLMSMIEDSVEKSTQWTVFEPNDDTLRRTVTHSLEVFLEAIWRTGGLKGATTAESFFVKCDDTNNPQSSVDAGQLVCQVGVAVAVPMEFLVFDIRRVIEGADIIEAEA